MSTEGRIRSRKKCKFLLYKNGVFKPMKPRVNIHGYLVTEFYDPEGEIRSEKRKFYFIHRLVFMTFKRSEYLMNVKNQINHINSNRRDNRLSNLELVTPRENNHHSKLDPKYSSKYTGVNWCNGRKKWCAKISINKRTINLGRYNTELEAALAYRKRFIEEGYESKYVILI